jgi:hypothetical protein
MDAPFVLLVARESTDEYDQALSFYALSARWLMSEDICADQTVMQSVHRFFIDTAIRNKNVCHNRLISTSLQNLR